LVAAAPRPPHGYIPAPVMLHFRSDLISLYNSSSDEYLLLTLLCRVIS